MSRIHRPRLLAPRSLVRAGLSLLLGASAAATLSAQTTVGVEGVAAAATLGVGARSSAAVFHAEGRDPYWTLDIDPAEQAVTWGQLGEADLTLAYAAPLPADTAGTVRYYFRGRQRLKASFTEVPCRDAETGNGYAYVALVEFGGRQYRGCATRGK